MDRVAQLIKTAVEIRRKIWASLPFFERFAEVLYRLGSSTQDAFGAGIYQLFLESGVQGMPDINGRPASEFRGRRLPSSYGRDFGKKVYSIVSRTFKNPQMVEDAMGDLLVGFLGKGKLKLEPGTPLKKAENYVLVSVRHKLLDMVKRKKWERNESEMRGRSDDYDAGPGYLDMTLAEEPGQAERFERSQKQMEKAMEAILDRPDVKAALRRIHPSAEQYARLMLEGYEDKEICADPATGRPTMLTHDKMPNGGKITRSAWTPNKKKIKALLMSEAAAAVEALGIAV